MPKGLNYAVETLELERKSYKEKIEALEDERDHFKKDVDQEIGSCRDRVRELNEAIVKLGGRAAAGTGGNGRKPKKLARCNNGKSLGWCYNCCPKMKDKSCKLIKFRKRKAAA